MRGKTSDLVSRLGSRTAPGRGEPPQHVAGASFVVVLPGCERFASGLGGGSFVRLGVQRFPNEELHVDVPDRVEGRHCVLVGSISPPACNVERVTLVAHALRRGGAARITALLPYLAYARQDRAADTESLGLAWVGELLRASGIGEVVCVDVHSERAAEVLGLALTSLPSAGLFAGALPEAWRADFTFVAPDEGAVDRCSAVACGVGLDRPVVWARKRRTSAGVEHLGLVGSPGRRAVVVDDIIDTGDTLVCCCRALRQAGTWSIGVVATHGLFTGQRWRALFAEGVQRIWITDTLLVRRRPPETEAVSVAPLLAPVVEGNSDRGGSDA